nr:hypothetical protein [Nocardiopsis quinghaiensis]
MAESTRTDQDLVRDDFVQRFSEYWQSQGRPGPRDASWATCSSRTARR